MTPRDDDFLRKILEQQAEVYLRHHVKSLEHYAAGVAHEFNNILAGISGYCQMALSSPSDSNLVQRALQRSLDASARGSELVKRLNYFAQTDNPQWEVASPLEIVRDMVNIFTSEAVHYEVTITTEFNDLPMVRFDASLLAIAINEILQNALHAMLVSKPSLRRISIVTQIEDGDGVIRIRDSGPGISDEDISMAFTPFFTRNGPIVSGQISTAKGLGLSVAHGIIKRHGGDIDINSEPGSGTEVRIGLPPAESLVRHQKRRILIVDDEPAIRRMFTSFLTKAGYDTGIAESGIEAIQKLLDETYDLVLLDQVMPGLSGMDVLQKMQDLPTDFPPVIMVTAAYSPQLAKLAFEKGAVACTTKPINRAKIIYLVSSYTDTVRAPQNFDDDTISAEHVANRVLIVDADSLPGELIELMLNRSGYQARRVATGAEAESATMHEYYDLILIDLLLHDRSSIEVIHQLRMNNPYTPILVTTTRASRQTLNAALQAGATRVIRKWIDLESILSEVEQITRIFREHSQIRDDSSLT